MIYPPAERQPVTDLLHGHAVPDPYRWLEDPASPRTRSWSAAQEDLWRAHAAALPGRDRWHARVAELCSAGTVTPPLWRGERRFFLRHEAGREHPVLYTAGPDGSEEALVDPGAIDPSGLTVLDRWQPDLTGRLLAYQLSRGGDERSELRVMEVGTRRTVDGPIDRCRYAPVAWLPDGKAFFYVRDRRVCLHRLGTPAADDVVVCAEERSYGLGSSHDGRWLTVSAPAGAGNDVWLADLAASPPERPGLRVVQEGADAVTVPAVGRDGRLYLLTTLDAPTGWLCVADPADPGPEGWRELVGPDPEAVISDFAVLDGPGRPVLLVGRTRHAISEIGVHDPATGERVGGVPLPGLGTAGRMSARPEGGCEVWFSYTDGVTPGSVHRYDARTGRTSLWAAAPGAVDAPELESRQIVYASADGTPVRMVVLARPGTGPRPAILYGYGGFGIPLTPSYSAYILPWVEAGGVFALAQVRGGGEEGAAWHRDGMLERKQNSIDDFTAAAERLITDGWTTAGMLAACGESNGGLLAGAAITQRPELFAAAACSAPLLDMVRYELSGLGPSWRGEYGSAEDPGQLAHLLGYSPYHRVREGVDYPATLLASFGGDSRVDPMHARKMCAALQHATSGDRPVLLRHEEGVGHGARAAGRAAWLAADLLAFLAAHTGLEAPPPGQ
ncbi:prolyl oligopeptidase family serine peptidase [Planomonospora parontospora]|uniref:prolyl oligopeptidase family serine peptidase n=1 Tax=Planomonospora parontospora TaxID=58119 RepID=UPI00166FF3D6|nr:prolyl oligopeptidase family serine peptidase [Planomonospora parontospora]GGL12684.1 prolyl endopeptidase [Planomonospora parontospora subsp. antibiotica]GII14011.1 prolyl endopeptidase [Planomonospora parontospora subsp. antibiotica]